jgi:hypothetical protein
MRGPFDEKTCEKPEGGFPLEILDPEILDKLDRTTERAVRNGSRSLEEAIRLLVSYHQDRASMYSVLLP